MFSQLNCSEISSFENIVRQMIHDYDVLESMQGAVVSFVGDQIIARIGLPRDASVVCSVNLRCSVFRHTGCLPSAVIQNL